MRSKRPGWAAAGRRSSLISALSGRRRFPVDFDELDEIFDAEVGERQTLSSPSPWNIPQQDSAERAFNKLTRTFAAQMSALKEYRSKGEQKMTVQHVHVAEGGQAIVGNVSAEIG